MSFPGLGDLSGRRRTAVRPSPLFLIVVAVAVVGGALSYTQTDGSRLGRLGVFLLVLGGWIVSVCLHEFAHAFAAFRAGDRSVEARGYLSLNPFKYAHPVLSILLPLVFIVQGGIGLPGGAVYLHRHAFRSRAMQSVAAAVGPLMNVVFAVVLLGVAKSHLTFFTAGGEVESAADAHVQFWYGVAFLGFLQVTAAVLNLLPVPGLDGWGILEPYLSRETVAFGDKVKPWGLLGVIVLFQVQSVRSAFFRLVYAFYDASGLSRLAFGLGQEYFRFWTKWPPF